MGTGNRDKEGAVTMVIEIEDYQIRPLSNSLCWEIWRRGVSKKTGEETWNSVGCYPSNLESALHKVYELCLKHRGTAPKGLKEAMREARMLAADVEAAAEKAVSR